MDNILTTPTGHNAIDLLEQVRKEFNPISGKQNAEDIANQLKALNNYIDELQDWAKGLTFTGLDSEREDVKQAAISAMKGLLIAHPNRYRPDRPDKLAKESHHIAKTLIKRINNHG